MSALTSGRGAGQTNAGGAASSGSAAPQHTGRELYHGVHPGSAWGDETSVADLAAYESAAGKKAAFVYFSQELNKAWLECKGDCSGLFPTDQLKELDKHTPTPVPFIRLMLRSDTRTNESSNREKLYNYDLLLNSAGLGKKEAERARKLHGKLLAWGKLAKAYTKPIYVEWGTEANGHWFWWNARWYAERLCEDKRRPRPQSKEQCIDEKGKEGAGKFRQSFIRLRQIINGEAQAHNVKWIFHVNASGSPAPGPPGGPNSWNSIESYYPGQDCAECVDAIGLSVYGAQVRTDPCDGPAYSFAERAEGAMDARGRHVEDSVKRIGKEKRLFLLEMGQTLLAEGASRPDSNCNAGKWAREALAALFDATRWEELRVAGFSWWNESWVDEKGVTDMRLNTFDICSSLSREDTRKLEASGLDCCCWREGSRICGEKTEREKCRRLKENRADLRRDWADALETHKTLLKENPAGL